MEHRSIGDDLVRLMHIPLPLCVLAFATIGAALSEHVHLDRLALTYLGILLALCLGAYSLDELHGRPCRTQFSDRTLWFASMVGIIGATLVSAYLAFTVSPYILILGILACFFVFAYNLELFGGRFHKTGWFAVSWGGLSTFGGYFVQAPNFNTSSVLASAMASLFSVAIIYLTHKFRASELSNELGGIATSDLRDFSRHARKVTWTITQIQCYSIILLAVALLIQKVT